MADANIQKAATLLQEKEREVIPNPDARLSFKAAEGAILILPSYDMADGDLDAMKVPAVTVPMPSFGSYKDFIEAVLNALPSLKGLTA